MAGDVIGRDFNQPGIGWFGHLGIRAENGAIFQADSAHSSNAINHVTYNQFRSLSPNWGTASARIPDGLLIKRCYKSFCDPNNEDDYVAVPARDGVSRMAYISENLGAAYTITAEWHYATISTPHPVATRGIYRCDTFAAAMIQRTSDYLIPTSTTLNWRNRMVSALFATPVTPRTVFDRLNSWR